MAEFEPVRALPRVGPRPALTGVACPDCGGSLTVRAEGDGGYLSFRCRIGHAFALESLLAAKEEAVERCLWVAVTRLEELRTLGQDLLRLGEPYRNPCPSEDLKERVARLEADSETVRRVAMANRPLALGVDQEPIRTC